ncbi:MAG TPA: Na+/H+ antiporter NhaA, partial [Fimbriimonadaceae bacterium]|nr:Na+/H+ antiporter NhaA [Fimbriimonadaceae bacterium]
FGLLVALNRFGVRAPNAYMIPGVLLWAFFLASGIHATIAGVLLAMTIPTRVHLDTTEFINRSREVLDEFEEMGLQGDHVLLNESRQAALSDLEKTLDEAQMPLERVENGLHSWVTFIVIPIFALANAGVALGAGLDVALGSPIALGIVLGLVIGKPIGITLFSWLAVKFNFAALPEGVTWRDIWATGILAGIGFTMSLFISELAFRDATMLTASKTGILAASLVAGICGYLLIRFKSAPKPEVLTQSPPA